MKPRKVSRRREFKFKDWEAGRKNEEESWGKKIKINSDSFENRQQFLNRISFTGNAAISSPLAICRRRPPPRSLRETARFRHVSLESRRQTFPDRLSKYSRKYSRRPSKRGKGIYKGFEDEKSGKLPTETSRIFIGAVYGKEEKMARKVSI